MKYSFGIIIPCFNEEKTVFNVVNNICNNLPDCQIIVVDDGSTDNSNSEIKKINQNNLTLIELQKNSGKGAAMRKGLDFIKDKKEIVIFTDADSEILIEDIIKIKRFYEENECEALFGTRFQNISRSTIIKMGLHRYLANKILTIFTNLLFKQNISDMETALKSFKSKYINLIDLKSDGFEIEPELVKEISRLGIKIKEIPINYEPRSVKEGKKISFKDGYYTLKWLIKFSR